MQRHEQGEAGNTSRRVVDEIVDNSAIKPRDDLCADADFTSGGAVGAVTTRAMTNHNHIMGVSLSGDREQSDVARMKTGDGEQVFLRN